MPLTHEMQLILFAAYWAIALPIAIFILRQVCALFGEGMPTKMRGFFMVVIIAPVAYLVFDVTAYVAALCMQGVVLQLPPWYGYMNWVREPLALKWQVLNQVPLLRYVPIVCSICTAGILEVFFLEEVPFRKALLMLIAQWVCTIVALYALGFAFMLGLGWAGKNFEHELPQISAKTAETTDLVGIHLKEEIEHAGSIGTMVLNFLKTGGWVYALGACALIWLVAKALRTVRKSQRRAANAAKKHPSPHKH